MFFTQLFDRKFQVLGDVEPAVDCVLRGSLAEGRLVGFHLDEGNRVVGGDEDRDGLHSRLMMGQPRASASLRRTSSGSTATGFVTRSSSGKSLRESL